VQESGLVAGALITQTQCGVATEGHPYKTRRE